jgi:hypothetical protein
MNTLNFLDANVWLALLWSRHIHSEKAKDLFERSSEEEFLFCRITQITVLRLLTTATVMGSDLKKMPEAWVLWDKVRADDRIAFLPNPRQSSPSFGAYLHFGVPLRKYGRMPISWLLPLWRV